MKLGIKIAAALFQGICPTWTIFKLLAKKPRCKNNDLLGFAICLTIELLLL